MPQVLAKENAKKSNRKIKVHQSATIESTPTQEQTHDGYNQVLH
jgi:hypothetical protein